MSAGSYGTFDAGGLGYSVELLDGDHGREGGREDLEDGLYGEYGLPSRLTGYMSGAVSRIDGSLDNGLELPAG